MAVTRLFTPRPYDTFDPGIAGVAPILATGTDVDNTKLTAVQAAAVAAGLGTLPTSAGGTAPTPTSAPLRLRGAWQANTAYQYGDVVLVVDGSGNTLAYSANLNFTSGSSFSATNWTELTFAGTGGGSLAVKDEGSTVVATASVVNFVGAGVTATDSGGGTATVTIPSTALGWVNVKDYGAKIDTKLVSDAAITTGTATLTSASAAFTVGDVGKAVIFYGAGAAGATLNTTISGYTNATTVTLAANAGTTVSGGTVVYGTDDAAAFQAAVTALGNANGGTLWWDGWAMFAGAQQTGSVSGTQGGAWTYNYSGQVLFPARAIQGGSKVTIRLAGPTPSPQEWWQPSVGTYDEKLSPGRSAIFSTATSGSVFDVIPHTVGNQHGYPLTDVLAIFENFSLLVPNNPTVHAINGIALASMGTDGLTIGIHAASGQSVTMTPTGNAVAIITPWNQNSAYVDLRRSQIDAYPIAVFAGEHCSFEAFSIAGCTTAVWLQAMIHQCSARRLLIQECGTIIKAGSTGLTIGGIAYTAGAAVLNWSNVELETAALSYLIDDPSFLLSGQVDFYEGGSTSAGYPVRGTNLSYKFIAPNTLQAGYWQSSYPWDTFGRKVHSASLPGSANMTFHPWSAPGGSTGDFHTVATTANNGYAQSGTSGNEVFDGVFYNSRAYKRVLTASITTNTTVANIAAGIFFSYNSGKMLVAALDGTYNGVRLLKRTATNTYATLASGTAGSPGVAANTTYTLTVVFDKGQVPGATQTVTIYLNGTLALTYNLTGTDVTDITPTATPNLQTTDGIWTYWIGGSRDGGTTSSKFNSFRVEPVG